MGFLTIDISKLSSNQTIQVIVSVLFISAASLVAQWQLNKTDSSTLNDMAETVEYINFEQSMLAEDVARVEEGQKDITDDVGWIKGDIAQVRLEQKTIKDQHTEDLTEIVSLLQNQSMFDDVQMEFLWEEFLKKKDRIATEGTPPPWRFGIDTYTAKAK